MGTGPVFLTSISTILGAIMFLRFGYAVGNVGLWGTWGIILLGHLVTIPTALAISEIATNQKVEGGGVYYIISRSFGIPIGASIGVALYLSQAISTAFYLIAFAQAFEPVFKFVGEQFGVVITDSRWVSVPALVGLLVLMLTRGAKSGAALLYIIAGIIFASLVSFFMGDTGYDASKMDPRAVVENPVPFFTVFAIVFPAFTGGAAGVGLSGDLKDPRVSIPLGTMAATLIGMAVYMFIPWKLAVSASPQDLGADQLIMSKIATWGPIIPIGLAAATISSALGSMMVAPRTLQALANDKIFISEPVNNRLAKLSPRNNEPIDATWATFIIALVFVLIGDVNVVAEIISMFFMVTYGSLCLISFLEHFAADPSYRPTFKSRWYLSLPGAILCFWLMFKMQPAYAALSLVTMAALYLVISQYNTDRGLAAIFQGVIFQVSRRLQVFLQKAGTDEVPERERWRPSVVCLSRNSFERFDSYELLRWLSHKYGFGTYIHLIEGYLSAASARQSEEDLGRLIRIADISKSNVYFDTMVSPSYTSAVAQVLQLPGISGKENNTILFEYDKQDPRGLSDIIDNYQLIKSTRFDLLILGSSRKKFGYRREIHIWITAGDYENANLMILLGYIILGHNDWDRGFIKIFDVSPDDELEAQRKRLLSLVRSGRLPISPKHIELIPAGDEGRTVKQVINDRSRDADLVILGFRGEVLKHQGTEPFEGFDDIGNMLFVNTTQEKEIS